MKLSYDKHKILILSLLVSCASFQTISLAQEQDHQHKQQRTYAKSLIQSITIDSNKLEWTNKEASAYRLLFEKNLMEILLL